ncbi:MAG TPA: rRNA maturation RNAse YbeY [Candidatus Paceibacterota bacterium]|nr:rRNA maturation RNAse YbeY [Candidatus Paceibacterota bacterium]
MSPLFKKIKNKVLGEAFDLSFAFVTPAQMRRAMKYKKLPPNELSKTKTSNVLSFPLSKTSGEILICKSAAKPYTAEYLFIHGLLHIKGLKHGATMERTEEKLLKQFSCKKLLPGSTSARTKSR